MATKYVSGRVRELKIGISSYSDNKTSLDVKGASVLAGLTTINSTGVNVIGIVTATSFSGSGQFLTDLPGGGLWAQNDTGINTSTNIGVGTTTASSALTVSGDGLITGVITATTFSGNITGVAGTFSGNIDVDGHTELDDVNVAGASTFTGAIDANGSLDVDGHTELDDVNVSGVSTFVGFSTFNDAFVSGVSTFTARINAINDLYVDGHTELDDVNIAGVATFVGDIKANGNIAGDSSTNITGIAGVTASTLAGTLQTAAQPNITSLGTLSAVTVSGDINANGNIVGDNSTDISGISSITASYFYGDGSGITNLPGIDTAGGSVFTNILVSGISTFSNNIDANGSLDVDGHTELDDVNIAGVATIASAKVSDLTSGRVVYAGAGGELQDSTNLTFDGTTLTGTFAGNGAALTNVPTGINTGGTSDFATANVVTLNVETLLDVDGHTELDDVNVAGVATIASVKVSDLTDNRIVIAGTAGELEDTTKLTFDGTTLTIVGDASFSGNVTVGGTLTSEDKTNIDSLGIVTARTGVRIDSGGLVVTSGVSTFTGAIDANGGANVDGGLVANSAKISDLSANRVVYSSSADGELSDSANLTFDGTTLTGTFAGDGSSLTDVSVAGIVTTGTSDFTNITVSGISTFTGAIDANGSLDVDGHTELDDVNVSGAITATTFTGNLTGTVNTAAQPNITSLGTIASLVASTAKVSDLTVNRVVTVGSSGELQDSANLGYDGTKLTTNGLNVSGNILAPNAGNFVAIGTENALGAGTDRLALLGSGTDSGVRIWCSASVHKATAVPLQVANSSGTELFRVHADGNIGVGSAAPSAKIDVAGTVKATDFDSTSDIRLKTNVQVIENPLDKVIQIEGVSFNWKEDNRPALGVIADQVQKIIPELVHGDNPKTVNYNGLIGLLIEAVKEQQIQIDELKSKLS